eukprot:7037632-Heterocapsa_arctica.AAC.1
MLPAVPANVSASFVAGEVEQDVVVALLPGFLVAPPDDLGIIPSEVVFGATLARLGPSGSQTGFPGKSTDGSRSYRRQLAHGALVHVVNLASHEVRAP